MTLDKKAFRERVEYWIDRGTGHGFEGAGNRQAFEAVSRSLMDLIWDRWRRCEEDILNRKLKRAYYLSAEFLIGRTLGNNLINLGIEESVAEVLETMGLDINAAEDSEPDAALGNGGLGRLAACFMDSLATMDLPARGYGIRYRYGMFRQEIVDGRQVERPDDWAAKGDPWAVRRGNRTVIVPFGGRVVTSKLPDGTSRFALEGTENIRAVAYDTPVIGYRSDTIDTLRLWEAESADGFDLQLFNDEEYQRAVAAQIRAQDISRVLYPNDRGPTGKALRLRQQYFFSSASLQDILREFKRTTGTDFEKLPEKVAIQLNDTHPVVAIPELMRLLMDDEGIGWDKAWSLTRKVFAYTNHTVLSEALEKWPVHLFKELLPRIYQIIEEINRRFMAELMKTLPGQRSLHHEMSIIADGMVKMAWLAIVGSSSVNGVAALHTEILKTEVLKEWYGLWPEKFNNKTNGVTQRRWLKRANPVLAELLDETIGPDWTTDLDRIEGIRNRSDDDAFLQRLETIKKGNKERLTRLIEKDTGITVHPEALFDVQVKRLHEYKRQLLNILHVIEDWHALRDGSGGDLPPRVVVFGAKAASGYHRAKQVIHLINAVSEKVNSDAAVGDRLKVVFMPNYRVSSAEVIIPAADISQQISTAGKEASGTGNMKFMMNGAVTLGTLDGANIEIVEKAGKENAFMFGMTADEVEALRSSETYNPFTLLETDPALKNAVGALVDGSLAGGDPFRELYDSLLYGVDGSRPDEYFVLQDYADYRKARSAAGEAWKDRRRWNRMALANIAGSGRFSSDRTVREYASEIWGITPRIP